MTGIEPALSAWEADVLPLNYIRGLRLCLDIVSTCTVLVPHRTGPGSLLGHPSTDRDLPLADELRFGRQGSAVMHP
jgi:hypothetical protein